MGSLARRLASTLATLSAVGACNELTGADGLRADRGREATGGVDGGSADPAAGADGRAPEDAGAATGDGAAPAADASDGVVLSATFSVDSECLGWTTAGTRVTDPEGRAAPGSCRLCLPLGGDGDLEKTLPVARSGRHELEAWAARPTNGGAATSFAVELVRGTSRSSVTKGLNASGWTSSKASISASAEDALVMHVGLRGASPGDCLLVDDVLVTVE